MLARLATIALLSLSGPGLGRAQEPAGRGAAQGSPQPEPNDPAQDTAAADTEQGAATPGAAAPKQAAAIPDAAAAKQGSTAVEPAVRTGMDDERMRTLVQALRTDESFKVRLQAAVMLGHGGDERAFEPLVAAMSSDESYMVRAVAAMALANLGDPRAISHLIKRIASDPDPFVRDEARRALASYEHEQSVPYVVASFNSEDPFVRREALEYLAKSSSPAARQVIIRALGDNEEIFHLAMAIIGDMKRPDSLSLLRSALDHRQASVRAGAVRVLHATGTAEAAQVILEVYERDIEADLVRSEARQALHDLRRFLPLERIVEQAVSDPEKHVRAKALKLLGAIGGEEAERVLIRALGDEDIYVRGTAVMALADLGDPATIPVLEKLENDPANQRIARLVRHALGQLRKKQAH